MDFLAVEEALDLPALYASREADTAKGRLLMADAQLVADSIGERQGRVCHNPSRVDGVEGGRQCSVWTRGRMRHEASTSIPPQKM